MRPAAFLGLFADVGIDAADVSLRFIAKLPVGDLAPLFGVIGIPKPAEPPEIDALLPGVLIAPCRRPVHPETEDEVKAEAALLVLEELIFTDRVPITGSLARRIDTLARAIPLKPLHIHLASLEPSQPASEQP